MKSRIYVKWSHFNEGVERIIEKLDEQKINPNGVYGIPRGGLILAVALSHRLAVPLLLEPKPGCLIVDDISDNGNTLMKYKDYNIATLFTTSWTKVKPTVTHFHKMSQHDWIVFPWEENTDKYIEQEMKGGQENGRDTKTK